MFRSTFTVVASVFLVGCVPASPDAPPMPLPEPQPTAVAPPYDRGAFEHWSDLDGDGCDTRDEILARDAREITFGADGCVDEVTVVDPYTRQRVIGRSEIDIDHVVALKDAWESGAWRWTDEQRERFANYEDNLVAASDDVNREKSDKGPDEWQPSDPATHCRYVSLYTNAKIEHNLTITPPEREALAVLCP